MKKNWCVFLVLGLVGILLTAGCSSAFVASFSTGTTSGPAPFSVSLNNTSSQADSYQWSFGDGQSQTTNSLGVVTHEYTTAGTYNVTITAVKGDKTASNSGTLVTVTHGPLATVTIDPTQTTLDPNASQNFSLACADEYGNPIEDYQVSWQVDSKAGTLKGADFTAGTTAGTFPDAIVATVKAGDTTLTANVSVTVNPGPLATVSLADVELPANGQKQLQVSASDEYGNSLQGLAAAWTIVNNASGTLTADGQFTAAKKAGSYPDAVTVSVKQGTTEKTATASVKVDPAGLDQVFIAPDNTQLGMGKTQQYVAAAADKYGNQLTGATFTWSATTAAGSFSGATFTAGSTPDTYANGITATAAWNGQSLKKSTDITVEPDRIVYLGDKSDPTNNIYDVFIMNADGTDVQQLTHGADVQSVISSPDGRRIAYITTDGLYLMDTSGDWQTQLLAQQDLTDLSWSPDGKTIAYAAWNDNASLYNIFTIDVATGETRQLTDNQVQNFEPSYSPNGKKIAYIEGYYQNGNLNFEVYVMNADGTSQTQVTKDSWYDWEPNWTPNGQQIIYTSERDVYYGLYTVNPDGSNLQHFFTPNDQAVRFPDYSPDGSQVVVSQASASTMWNVAVINADATGLNLVTHNTDYDCLYPSWMHRVRGVDISASAIIIPDKTGTVAAMTVQQVTDQYKASVVRIETDLGVGTGFIIKPDGTILTAAHVVRDATTITVYLSDGTTYPGTVLGMDTIHDIALVKITATGLTVIDLASGGSADLGEQVVVMGYALGSKNLSVTTGIVSSLNYDSGTNVRYVQTDSAVNPGNSGGPMLNLNGQLIGMVTAKAVGFAVEGVGYAISTETLLIYVAQLGG